LLGEPIESILDDYPSPDQCLLKMTLNTAAMRNEAMHRLYSMNITNASLFPDLDGLAKSLAYELEYHWGFDTRTMEPKRGFPRPVQLPSWFTPLGTIYPHSKAPRADSAPAT